MVFLMVVLGFEIICALFATAAAYTLCWYHLYNPLGGSIYNNYTTGLDHNLTYRFKIRSFQLLTVSLVCRLLLFQAITIIFSLYSFPCANLENILASLSYTKNPSTNRFYSRV